MRGSVWPICGPARGQAQEDIRMNVDGVGAGCMRVATSVAAVCLSLMLAGCAPVPDPSAGLSVEESVQLIEQVAPSEMSPETVAEAFALGSRATDVQRDDITQALVGHRIAWAFPVYEVEYAEGRYTVTSQPIPIQDTEAAALTRVMAFVIPQSEEDEALLRGVKTDDVIRIRGIVQEIRLRTFVVVVPAVVVGRSDGASPDGSGQIGDVGS